LTEENERERLLDISTGVFNQLNYACPPISLEGNTRKEKQQYLMEQYHTSGTGNK